MKKKVLLLILLFVLFIGRVSAEKIPFEASDFFNYATCETAADGLSATCVGQTFNVDLSINAIVYTTVATNVKDAVETSPVLAFIANGDFAAFAEEKAQYSSLREAYGTVSKSIDYTVNGGCDLENLGFCYEESSEGNTMKVAMNDTFLRFLIKEYGGTIEDEGSKASTDPNCYECEEEGGVCCPQEEQQQQQEEQSSDDSNNPDTGSFAEYGFIALLGIVLIVLVVLKKRSEIEYKI